MGRSLKKGPFVDAKLLKKVERLTHDRQEGADQDWARRSTVTPEFVGHTFLVHDGRRHVNVYVTEEMVGHKLGEFCAPSRTFRGHGGRGERSKHGPASPHDIALHALPPRKCVPLPTYSRQAAGEGLLLLRFKPNRGARMLEKVLQERIANCEDRGARNVKA